MYSKIMVPVDLGHVDRLDKALKTAADLARHYKAEIIYVAVTSSAPSSVAHSPEEFAAKLESFADGQAAEAGIGVGSKAYTSHDPATDLDDTLLKAVGETGADLVVMQSHVPNITDYIWPSNGGTIATHSDASVLVVR